MLMAMVILLAAVYLLQKRKDHTHTYQDDLYQTIKNLQNQLFKLNRNQQGEIIYTLFEGREARVLGLTTKEIYGKTVYEVLPHSAAELILHYEKAFSGERVQYEIELFGKTYYTSLSPIVENDRVQEVVGTSIDITERKRFERQVLEMEIKDTLTKLPNRSFLEQAFDQLAADPLSPGHVIAVIIIDLDRFRQINDHLGYMSGDQILTQAAERLQSIVGNNQTVARKGGDEFIILLQNVSLQKTDYIANRILYDLSKSYYVDEQEYMLTSSVGVSIYPHDGTEIQLLINQADKAMYQAKQKRNTYCFFSKEMTEHVERNLQIESGLRLALKGNAQHQLMLYYQPQFNLANDQLIGVEALLRWKHPKFGFISPAEFIPVAEQTGLIIQLGEWVLQTACEQLRSWQSKGLSQLRMAVNISARQFDDPFFIPTIFKVLQQTEIAASSLDLELTESIFQVSEQVVESIAQLKKHHIHISIDDFGTGYSSLSYLKNFPIDTLKVDQSFVKEIQDDLNDAAIVRAIIALAKSLNIQVIAEGVETEEQLLFLRQQQCHMVQGYFYSKPLPKEQFEKRFLRPVEA